MFPRVQKFFAVSNAGQKITKTFSYPLIPSAMKRTWERPRNPSAAPGICAQNICKSCQTPKISTCQHTDNAGRSRLPGLPPALSVCLFTICSYSLNHTPMYFRLFLITDSHQQNIPCILLKGNRILLLPNLTDRSIRLLIPFQFCHQRRVFSCIFRLRKKYKSLKGLPISAQGRSTHPICPLLPSQQTHCESPHLE